jgi:hypothetical protein
MNPQNLLTTLRYNRRDALILASVSLFTSLRVAMAATQAGTEEKFNYLSKNGGAGKSSAAWGKS